MTKAKEKDTFVVTSLFFMSANKTIRYLFVENQLKFPIVCPLIRQINAQHDV